MKPCDDKLREISDWLIVSALTEKPIKDTIRLFAERLLASGIPVHRINCSTFQRHQIMGAVDTTWEKDGGVSDTEFVPKSMIINSNIFSTPVGAFARSSSDFERHDLSDRETQSKFEIFESMHERGYSDYLLLKHTYGRDWDFLDTRRNSEGVYGSFATKDESGFSNAHIEAIRSLWGPFSLFLKTSTEQMLSAQLLEAYVGRLPAQNILSGMIERGDGNGIRCVLWYSDLRNSTILSANLPTGAYLELLNAYFDCTAGSVIDHGGEVLKLIGDGVMAIFPLDDSNEKEAFSSALSAAQASLLKADHLRSEKSGLAANDLSFGIGLHVGEVILGNVGTADRLDMTVIGASVNQVTRIEALTKSLGLSVLASPQFFQSCEDGLISLGKYPVPDLGGMTEIFSLVER